jgi:signal transduction histidine kinase
MPADLPEEHKTCVYRLVQEALTNVSRHAQASTVQVSLQRFPGIIDLTVQDDGSGFDADRVRGLGLLGMEERVKHLGGQFNIDSHPGLGTRLKVTLPLADLALTDLALAESATDEENDTHPHSVGRRS